MKGNDSTRDVVCINFNFGASSYKQQVNKLKKSYEKLKDLDPETRTQKKKKLDQVSAQLEEKKLIIKRSQFEIYAFCFMKRGNNSLLSSGSEHETCIAGRNPLSNAV